MDAYGGPDPVVLFGEGNGGVEFFRTGARANGEEGGYARGAGAFEHGGAVFVELREVNVGVGVDEIHWVRCGEKTKSKDSGLSPLCGAEKTLRSSGQALATPPAIYFRRVPTGTSSRKPARTGRF